MSHHDDNNTGPQVLPVADLPSDFSGEAEDGAQYLFTVRREAATIPNQKRVTNPFEAVENDKGKQKEAIAAQDTHLQEPSLEWRLSYSANFKNLRSHLNSRDMPALSDLPDGYMPFPGKKDRGGWLNYINDLAREPKLSIMKSLTSVSALTLMTFLVEDARARVDLGDRQTRWLLYLMASRPDDHSGNFAPEYTSDKKNLWMVLVGVIGGYGQYDLYNEACAHGWN